MTFIVKGDITLECDNNTHKTNKNLAFKNNAPFINCISNINVVKIHNAEDLHVVMSMFNLLKYSQNYKKKQEISRIIIENNQVIHFF